MAAPTNPAELAEIAARTLRHYESQADDFWSGTRDHDVSQNLAALLDALQGPGPWSIFDFGCGPGRDLLAFRQRGHIAVGLDGCAAFVGMAREHSGCEVLHQSFFELDLRGRAFDGVFANASLFHVPRGWLPAVLHQLRDAIRPGGVLFCSNPRAFERDMEGWQGERYGSYLTIESWIRLVSAAGFEIERTFLRPTGSPPSQQPWLAMTCRKPTAPVAPR
jgi:SAM-dependent methyltransferase